MTSKTAVQSVPPHVSRQPVPPTTENRMGAVTPRNALAIPINSSSKYISTNDTHLVTDKLLICHFFERAYAIASAEVASRSSNASTPTHPLSSRAVGPTPASRRTSLESEKSAASVPTAPASNKNGDSFLCNLFPLTPSVKEQERYSQRSGRMLSESESLQLKHAEEYQFLLPTLTYALQHTITAHDEMLAQEKERRRDEISKLKKTLLEQNNNDETCNAVLNAGNILCPSVFECFITPDIPAVTLLEYLKRIIKYTYASPSVLLVACMYIDRLLSRWEGLLFHTQVAFKLIIAAVRIASKVLDTRTLNNKDFAVVGGVSNEELNELELHFIANIDYDVYVSAEEFGVYASDLVDAAAGKPQPSSINFDRAPQPPAAGDSPAASSPTPQVAFAGKRNRRASIAAVLPSGRRRSYSIVGQGPTPNLRSASRPGAPPTESGVFNAENSVCVFEVCGDGTNAVEEKSVDSPAPTAWEGEAAHSPKPTNTTATTSQKRPSLTNPAGNRAATLPQVARKPLR